MDVQLNSLRSYSSCDISDALLKLSVPGAGFLADINPRTVYPAEKYPLIGPVSTVNFHPKPLPKPESTPDVTPVPSGSHFADSVAASPILVLGTAVGYDPQRDTNAILGGLIATRLSMRDVKAVIVDGRVRDLGELQQTGMAVLARGTSTVGAGGGHLVLGTGGVVKIGKVRVKEGDIAYIDEGGVVIIPRDKVGSVLDMLPALISADEGARADVLKGMELGAAFKKHRGKV